MSILVDSVPLVIIFSLILSTKINICLSWGLSILLIEFEILFSFCEASLFPNFYVFDLNDLKSFKKA